MFLEQETIDDLVFNEGYGIDIEGYSESEYNLVNNTWGGEGVSGYRHTEEENKKSSHFELLFFEKFLYKLYLKLLIMISYSPMYSVITEL